MTTIDNFNFGGKKALIRVDYNVPLDEHYKITDDTRIKATTATIKKILADGGSVVLMSHLGRPKNGPEERFSLKHIVPVATKLLGANVSFAGNCIGEVARDAVNAMRSGEILLLENLRFHKEEEQGDEEFAGKLSSLGDIYVNDAFGTAHRAHASTAIIAKFFPNRKCFGYVMSGEMENINKLLHAADKPFTAVLGGAKVSDKILILEQLIEKANNIIIGGGMAFTFIKAQGGNVGKSLVEADRVETAMKIIESAKKKNVRLCLPVDAVCADKFSNDAKRVNRKAGEIQEDWMGLDIGPESEKLFSEIIMSSKTILWNGPMGVFEMINFEHGTKTIAHSIASATSKGAFSLIGGGDSVAAINKYNLGSKVSYVSTGGGAMLEYIESGTLPGIEAVEN